MDATLETVGNVREVTVAFHSTKAAPDRYFRGAKGDNDSENPNRSRMPTPSDFHDVVSGHRRGLAASLTRWGLRAAEVPYTWAVRYRNHRFDRGHSSTHRVAVPVVSVGNLTLGGTGKTPMVAWLAKWCSQRSLQVAIVSRGYGAARGEPNDESRELASQLNEVLHIQNPDRVAGARLAIQQGAQVILLDDGFQHRRLDRDLDIVLLDALQPTGFGHVFPRGCLREPFHGIRRASIVVLTRSAMMAEEDRHRLRQRIRTEAPQALWLEANHTPIGLIDGLGRLESLSRLEQEPVIAFCGIGNPGGFRQTLADCGCVPREFLEFPDHHRYTRRDEEKIRQACEKHHSTLIVCTHKDLVKVDGNNFGQFAIRAVQIEMRWHDSQPLERRLEEITRHSDQAERSNASRPFRPRRN